MAKIMRVNLSESKVKVEEMPKKYRGLGGRGLSSHIIGREVPPKTDPLGSENKLIFSAGIFGRDHSHQEWQTLSVGKESPDEHDQGSQFRRIRCPKAYQAWASSFGDRRSRRRTEVIEN